MKEARLVHFERLSADIIWHSACDLSDVTVGLGLRGCKFISVNTAAWGRLWSQQKHANHVNTKIHDFQLQNTVKTKYVTYAIYSNPEKLERSTEKEAFSMIDLIT